MHAPSTTCLVRSLHSLRDSDVRIIEAMLAATSGKWSLERHDDYDGDLSVLLSPECGGGARPSFFLHRTAAGIHLVDASLDGYRPLGTYKALSAAILRLRRLAASIGQEHMEQEHRTA